MDGILNIDKPRGLTSHDVVERIRRLTKSRAGHAGTLDPNATGVLLVCVGKATRVAEYLTAGRKRYLASILLGVTTDTYDADGKTVDTQPVDVTEAEVLDALDQFRGPIQQIPPAFSALKKNGKPLYKLARRGVEVERNARRVEVYELVVEKCTPPDVVITVECSAGTYLRSIAYDLGVTLGCGGHLAALSRTASGPFKLEDAAQLNEIERVAREGDLSPYVLPLDSAVSDYPTLGLNPREVEIVRHGGFVCPTDDTPESPTLCRAYDADGRFVALLRFDVQQHSWRPHKVFLG